MNHALSLLNRNLQLDSEAAFDAVQARLENEKKVELETLRQQYDELVRFVVARVEQSSAEMIAELLTQQQRTHDELQRQHDEAERHLMDITLSEHEAAIDKLRQDFHAREQQLRRTYEEVRGPAWTCCPHIKPHLPLSPGHVQVRVGPPGRQMLSCPTASHSPPTHIAAAGPGRQAGGE